MDIIRITKTGSELYTKAMELYKMSRDCPLRRPR